MTYSNEIPANVIAYVRAGSKAELDDAGAELAAAEGRVLKDREGRPLSEHEREQRQWRDPFERYGRHDELLDLIGWTNTEAVEMNPDHHLLAVTEAVNRFERDHPGVGTAEIEASGLAFKRGGE